jgi:hypothetical protein
MKYTKLFLAMAGRKGGHREAAGGKGTAAAAAAGNVTSGRTEERKDGRNGRKEGREGRKVGNQLDR